MIPGLFSGIRDNPTFGINFASNGKGYPFARFHFVFPAKRLPLSACWGVPQAPDPAQECVGRTPCKAWWLPRPGGRLKIKYIVKAGNGVKGKINAPRRAPDTVPGFCFWVDKAVKPQCGFTGPVPDFSLFPAGSPVPVRYVTARPYWP